ncbi:MAG: phenylalanine--tRNA ligase subunit beta, partial [Raoultibacter sp.]
MLVSLKWLNEYVQVPGDIKALCDLCDLTGTGVEAVNTLGEAYDHIVVGQIAERGVHPDSDHMWVCKVDVGGANTDEAGNPEALQIVCGAQNFDAGDKIPVAMVGAVMPDGTKIKKSKLRGVTSCGMNCSSRELGLGTESDGIWILSTDAPVGVPFADYMKLSDTVLDLEITPNRPDCLSMVGMAREMGAMLREPVTYPGYDLAEIDDAASEHAGVTIEGEDRCSRYTARVIKNVKVGPSPDWLVERIQAAGARSINNIVDATNYILFLLGQPLHAFDFDKLDLENGRANIIVRPAEEGEKFTTLDGEERVLKSDMTVIATPQRPIALAGVMGGLETEVTEETTTVLLEAAVFSSAHTSRTSRNLGLISESSIRYERGVDDNPLEFNAEMAAALIAEVSGGQVCCGMIDVWPTKSEPTVLSFRIERFNAMMGAAIARAEIEDILSRLGCEISEGGEGVLGVVAPTFRPDLEREIDLYEEVLRLYGMDKITSTLPGGRGRVGTRSEEEHVIDKIHAALRACGLNETMNYSFAEPGELDSLRMSTEGLGQAVELLNPMNADQSVMRRSIVP